jgi:excinuclease ABC subunit C
VPQDLYRASVDDAIAFLEGRETELTDRLRARMEGAAAELHFEEAARVRDQLQAVERSLEKQRVLMADQGDRDVLGLHREGPEVVVQVLAMREGKLQDAQAFTFRDQEFPDEELLSSFLSLFYEQNPAPDEVLVPLEPAEAEALAEVLSERRGKRVRLLTPQRGAKADLLEVARRNAEQGFRSWHEKDERREQALVSLTRALHLARPPRWMECYDISTFQGALAVGSGVSMKDGEPDKANYRRYKVKGIPERRGSAAPRAEAKPEQPMPQDDFAMLYEVVTRRLRRALAEGQLPDLLVVDGGKGQLNAALAAAKDLGVPVKPLPGNEGAPFVELVGLAKSRVLDGPALGTTRVVSRRAARDRAVERDLVSAAEAQEKGFVPEIQRSAERVFLPGRKDPVILRQNSAELFLLARLRDEAHRFAITFHRKLRRERNFQSVLEEIPGIGEGRKKALLRHFGSLRRVKEATLEELAQVEGFGEKQAAAVRAFFHRPAPGGGEEPEVEVEPEGAPGGEGGVDPGPPAVVTEDEIDAALAAETTSGPEPTEA